MQGKSKAAKDLGYVNFLSPFFVRIADDAEGGVGASQRLCKVYRNFLKSNSFYQHPFRVIRVIRDSDN